MPLFKLDDVFTYQDANEIKTLWAGNSDPAKVFDPETEQYIDSGLYSDGEIWLDTGNPPDYFLKRFNGTSRDWDLVAGLTAEQIKDKIDGYFIRKDVDDAFSNKLTSTKSGAAMEFDGGHSMITVHDGSGNFNIKSGVDETNTTISTSGGSHIRMDEAGGIYLNVSSVPIGTTFAADTSFAVTSGGVSINGSSVWYGGNQGNGSGLDADLLDGQQGSFYRDASNLNSGTLLLDRLPGTLTGKDADTLDGQHGSYYTNADNLNAGAVPRAQLANLGNVNNPYLCAGKTNVTAEYQIIAYGAYYSSAPIVVASSDKVLIPRIIAISTTAWQVQLVRTNYPTNDFWAGMVYWMVFGNKPT